MPKPPLVRSNGDDRRQRRKQGGAVGAAASKDASGSEADAGSRNPGSVTEGDGEGGNMSKKSLEILEDKSKSILTQVWKTVL